MNPQEAAMLARLVARQEMLIEHLRFELAAARQELATLSAEVEVEVGEDEEP